MRNYTFSAHESFGCGVCVALPCLLCVKQIRVTNDRCAVFGKLGGLRPWSSADVTSSNALMAVENDIDDDIHAKPLLADASFGDEVDTAGRPHYREV